MLNMDALVQRFKRVEGLRLHLYRCPAGKISVGVGRNIEDVGIFLPEAEMMLDDDILRNMYALDRFLPWWRSLSDVQQRVLIDMSFNLGIGGLMEFHKMLGHLERGEYARAAVEMLDSKYARMDVPARAAENARWMRTNSDAEVTP